MHNNKPIENPPIKHMILYFVAVLLFLTSLTQLEIFLKGTIKKIKNFILIIKHYLTLSPISSIYEIERYIELHIKIK